MDFHYLIAMPPILEAEARVTRQNQTTIPAAIRQVLKLGSKGGRIVFRVVEHGRVTVESAEPAQADVEDPALEPFLKLLEKDMARHPRRIKPLPAKLLARAQALIKGVELDLNGPLTGAD